MRDTPRRSSVGGVVSKLDRHDEVGRAARQAARADDAYPGNDTK